MFAAAAAAAAAAADEARFNTPLPFFKRAGDNNNQS